MKLSEHFTLEELTMSQTASRWGIDNTPDAAIIANLTKLAQVLEQVRKLVGAPVSISSGYRCRVLNAKIGGAEKSAHVLGLAADIHVSGWDVKKLAKAIAQSGIQFDQVIYEGTWVHIGIEPAMRNELLTATFSGGIATYTRGIV